MPLIGGSKTDHGPNALGSVCDEAKAVIQGERQDSYGDPEFSFGIIADFWSAYLDAHFGFGGGVKLDPLDVAHMMILFKVARCVGQKQSRDSYVDLAGYADIAANRCLED